MKRLLLSMLALIMLLVVQTTAWQEGTFDVCQKTCNYKQPNCQCSGCCVAHGCDTGGMCRNKMCVCDQCPEKTTTTTATWLVG